MVRHKPKQVARHTCPEQPLVEARTQAEQDGSRSRSHDCASFCGDVGGWDCGGGDDSLSASYAPFDMPLRGMLG